MTLYMTVYESIMSILLHFLWLCMRALWVYHDTLYDCVWEHYEYIMTLYMTVYESIIKYIMKHYMIVYGSIISTLWHIILLCMGAL